MDKLLALKMFVATVDAGGFSAAARRLEVATSTVTRMVDALEQEQREIQGELADGAVYVGSVDGYLYALDEGSGALRWKLQGSGPFVSSPAVHGRHLVQCGGAGDGTIRLVERGCLITQGGNTCLVQTEISPISVPGNSVRTAWLKRLPCVGSPPNLKQPMLLSPN